MAFQRGERDQAERRNQSVCQKRKRDQADTKQYEDHQGRPDIRHVIEQAGQHTEHHGVGKTDQPGAERYNARNPDIDDRHHGQVAGEIALDVAHDLQKAQFDVATAEQGYDLIAQFDFADQEKQQGREEKDELSRRGRDEGHDRKYDIGSRHIGARPRAVAEQCRFQLVQGS